MSFDRFATDFIADMRAQSISPTLEFYSFDSRNDMSQLPDIDLFGPSGFAFDEMMGGEISIATAFIISTVNDRNGYRHLGVLHELHQLLRPGRRIWMLDADTGARITQMIITEANLGPTARSEVRPMQGFAIKLLPAFISG